MRKLFALLLAMAMCISMAACGGTSAEEPKTDADVESTETTEENQGETESDDPYVFETVFVLTPEEAEEAYQKIMSGEIDSEGADVIRSEMDEYTAKLTLDTLAMMFGKEEYLNRIAEFDYETMDNSIMPEVEGILNAALAPDDEDDYDDEGGEYIEGMGTSMTLYEPDLDRSIVVDFDPEQAFLEPDWAMMTDQPINYFISMDNNYQTYTLAYTAFNATTEQLIAQWIANDKAEGIDTTATDIETFMAGGFEWEIFALTYEKTSTGIDKETGKEITDTYTAYETICFARLDSETILQIDAGVSHIPDVLEYYKDLIQSSITKITVQ